MPLDPNEEETLQPRQLLPFTATTFASVAKVLRLYGCRRRWQKLLKEIVVQFEGAVQFKMFKEIAFSYPGFATFCCCFFFF